MVPLVLSYYLGSLHVGTRHSLRTPHGPFYPCGHYQHRTPCEGYPSDSASLGYLTKGIVGGSTLAGVATDQLLYPLRGA